MYISQYKKKLFNDIYFRDYLQRLKEMGLNPKENIIVKAVQMHGIIDYPFESRESFYNIYFQYLSDHLGTDIETAYDFYIDKYDLFCEVMAEELEPFTDEEIVELYVEKTIYNHYNGLKFEKDVLSLISESLVHRENKERDYIDNVLKIDLELQTDNTLYGLQLKACSYLRVDDKLKQYHHKMMHKYKEQYNATDVFYILHNNTNQPMALRNNGFYLIPYEEINNYTINDFIVGDWDDLQNELNNLK